MKKFKLLALALAIGTTSLFGMEIAPDDVPVTTIRNQIEDLFSTPEFPVNEETVVNVTFIFDSNKKIVVTNIDSDDSNIIDYVQESIHNQRVELPGKANESYKFSLRLLSK